MATINYNGMELEEVTEPQIFDPPRTMLVWVDCLGHVEDNVKKAEVVAILPRTALKYPIITEDDGGYEHGAFIPGKSAPRRATNRELSKWLAQGMGEVTEGIEDSSGAGPYCSSKLYYSASKSNEVVENHIRVRKWDDTEWHFPDVEYMGITEVKTYEDVVKREG